ncbi:site-specific integrase [Kribbella sindirgiensis]|uniref:Site-specific integrase n=1 Tax=Kribbella sindirgiensis TaxID=1124744 RepID=A0A4R0IMW7_9ACTN|nr:site-specific integrase [Kribbella sindirgiensis]
MEPEVWSVAFVKDQWTRAVKQPSGEVVRERKPARWGKGKRWLAVWHGPNGDEVSMAFETKIAAERHGNAMETDIARGEYIDPAAGKMRLAEVAERWMKSRSVDPSSEIQYESKWRLHVAPTFGKRQVKSIKPSEIAVWLKELTATFGPSTARSAFLVLFGCLELAVEDEALKKNPAKSKLVKRPPTVDPSIVVWPDETVDAIIAAHPEQYRLIPIIGDAAGLRQGEIFGLSPDDFDFEERVIRVRRQVKKLGKDFVFALPKNDKVRTVPMPDSVAELVQEHIARFGTTEVSLPWERLDGDLQAVRLMFTWSDGKQIRARNFDETIWKPSLALAGVIPPPPETTAAAATLSQIVRPACTLCGTTTPVSRSRTGSTSRSSRSTWAITTRASHFASTRIFCRRRTTARVRPSIGGSRGSVCG